MMTIFFIILYRLFTCLYTTAGSGIDPIAVAMRILKLDEEGDYEGILNIATTKGHHCFCFPCRSIPFVNKLVVFIRISYYEVIVIIDYEESVSETQSTDTS